LNLFDRLPPVVFDFLVVFFVAVAGFSAAGWAPLVA